MQIKIRKYEPKDAEQAAEIWNHIVDEGIAFPQEEDLTQNTADAFFRRQTYTGIALNAENGEMLGLYILHPNNIGRCGHICNASYAVRADLRGQHIGRELVLDCFKQAAAAGFRILQLNAVVASNTAARKLYEELGFVELGTVPGGFHVIDGSYCDIVLYYKTLQEQETSSGQ